MIREENRGREKGKNLIEREEKEVWEPKTTNKKLNMAFFPKTFLGSDFKMGLGRISSCMETLKHPRLLLKIFLGAAIMKATSSFSLRTWQQLSLNLSRAGRLNADKPDMVTLESVHSIPNSPPSVAFDFRGNI